DLFFALPDGPQVNPAFVSQVQQIVDGQTKIRLDTVVTARWSPFRMIVPANIGNQIGLGPLCVAHPYPQQPVPLSQWIAGDASLLGNMGLAGRQSTGTVQIKPHSVV